MAKELLENEGIRAMVVADDCAGMYPQFQSQSKGVRLLVAPDDLEQAQFVLGIMEASD
jgi:predicted Fe-Mo cluster-binding NifX family protein